MENPRDTLVVNLEVVVALATVVIANVTTVAITLIQQSATRRQLQAQSDAEAARWMGGDLSRAREREEDRDHQRQLDRLAAQRALDAIWRAERLEVDRTFLRAGRAYADVGRPRHSVRTVCESSVSI